MQGKIIKGIAGFYYVAAESGIYECRAKGIFRKEKKKPLVGDNVTIEVLDEENKEGNLTGILPRVNDLVRPAVANVDQALVIFAAKDPKPNFSLLDRFLIAMERQNIPAYICINKKDLVSDAELQLVYETYSGCGYPVIAVSAAKKDGVDVLENLLRGKTTVIAGPSGVGKSSLTNLLQKEVQMETGEISKKLGRGKHTTRHSQLITLEKNTYLMDTPGFTSLYVEDMEKEELRCYFTEFDAYEGQCRFQGCVHIHEPGCAVKEALAEGKISKMRYQSYKELYEELKEKRRY
ncbi:MAG: ribosome small subunit-dependent GTPase A [Lachnospiraceae bacterium]|jgi:ribosome biogenesis GTPase